MSGFHASQHRRPHARRRIDVHAHFLPDFYRDALRAAGLLQPDGIKALPSWSEEHALQTMDRLDIESAILSISSPGIHFGDDAAAASLARSVNSEASRLADTYSGRFGFFASLPLPDVKAAVAEAIFALDTLNADGVVLATNQDGIYLGDERLYPLYDVLNERRSVVFIHPTSPGCICSARLDAHYPRPMLEFMFETTRSVADMILSGVLERYPEIRIIVPHAGAALPLLSERIELLLPLLAKPEGKQPPSVRAALRHLHYDLAGAAAPHMISTLLSVCDTSRLHYGSDFPFTPSDACSGLIERLETFDGLNPDLLARIHWDNSAALLPGLKFRHEAEQKTTDA